MEKVKILILFCILGLFSEKAKAMFENENDIDEQGINILLNEDKIKKGKVYISTEILDFEWKLNVYAIYDMVERKMIIQDSLNYIELIERKELILEYKLFGKKKEQKILLDPKKNYHEIDIPKEIESKDILYKLRVYDREDNFDETEIKKLNSTKASIDLEILREKAEEKSTLKEKNIYSKMAKVKFLGRDFQEGQIVRMGTEEFKITERGNFYHEELAEQGRQFYTLEVFNSNMIPGTDVDSEGNEKTPEFEEKFSYEIIESVEVEVEEKFLLGMADMMISSGEISGSTSIIGKEEFYSDDLLTQGRIAAYGKKRTAEYTLTGYIDTKNQELTELHKGLGDRRKEDLFKELSEDEGYIFGDGSTMVKNVETQGQIYLKVEWDKNKVMWGNYSTEINQGEFLNYSKSLYGAQLEIESFEKTINDESVKKGNAFFSNPEVGSSFNIFLATGGSLYYLNHKDIVKGSEIVTVEIKNEKTGKVLKTISYSEEEYSINTYTGRIILNEPLSQYGYKELNSSIGIHDINEITTYLKVSYEYYNPDQIGYSQDSVMGGEYEEWINDNWKVGVVGVQSADNNEDYSLYGISQTYKQSENTYIEMEYAESSGKKVGTGFFSATGGLKFTEIAEELEDGELRESSGTAIRIAGSVDLNEKSEKFKEGSLLEFYYSNKEAGFAVESIEDGVNEEEYGLTLTTPIDERTNVSVEYSVSESEDKVENYAITVAKAISEKLRMTFGIANETTTHDIEDGVDFSTSEEKDQDQLSLQVQADYIINDKVTVNGSVSGGEDEITYSAGVTAQVTEKFGVTLETQIDDSEETVLAGINYSPVENYEIYIEGEGTQGFESKDQNITIGQSAILNEKYEVVQESQFGRTTEGEEIAQIYGVNVNLNDRLSLTFGYEQGELFQKEERTKRQSASIEGNYRKKEMSVSTRLEYSNDKTTGGEKAESIQNWLFTNTIKNKINNEITVQLKTDFGVGFDKETDNKKSELIDISFGIAYRPIWNDKLNLLGRYNYTYDVTYDNNDDEYNIGQFDERTSILAFDTIYEVNKKLTIAGKYAVKISEMKAASDESEWYKAMTSLYAINFDYKFKEGYSFETEYHWLMGDQGAGVKSGAIVTLNRRVNERLKAGVGYNFTEFTSDLKYDDYDAKGIFLNITGVF